MARKPRLHIPGALYHVILRGNARQDIFFTPEDRGAFYELLAEGVRRFGYRVHAFCLMSNHVHLALQAGDESLSRGLQNLAFRYTRHVNTARKRAGTGALHPPEPGARRHGGRGCCLPLERPSRLPG